MSTLPDAPTSSVAATPDAAAQAAWRAALAAPPLGFGRTADVYAWQPGWVLKLFRADVPRPYVDRESRSARAVYDAVHAPPAGEAHHTSQPPPLGVPVHSAFCVPAVGDTLMVGARAGLLYAHAEGASLARAFLADDRQALATRIGERLADLHLAIHAIAPRAHGSLDALPDQRDWLQLAIETARELSPAQKSALLHELHALDYAPDSLCHGDFHPYNVLQQPDGSATVIDWVSSARGHALCDAAKTAVRLRFAPSAGQTQIAPAHLAMRRAVHDAYLQRYCERYSGRSSGGSSRCEDAKQDRSSGGDDPRAICERWLPLAAAARLVEGVGLAERNDLLAFIQHRLTGVATGSAA